MVGLVTYREEMLESSRDTFVMRGGPYDGQECSPPYSGITIRALSGPDYTKRAVYKPLWDEVDEQGRIVAEFVEIKP